MVKNGCLAYLAFVRDANADTPTVKLVLLEDRVIAYTSLHMMPHEKNNLIHDLELVAIVHTLNIWRHYLYGVSCEHGDARDVTIGDDGVLRMQCRICVPNVDVLRELILQEAHSSCQQFKYEHQRPGGLLHRLIPEWKWEHITMGFVVGIPGTLKKCDAMLVIVDRLTKSAHFIPVVTTYFSEQLAQIYICEIVRLHDVHMSIILDRGTQLRHSFG
ncbi:uncharacterized protein [Nicotiana tomentosiformis]|uniref:uncharacterized protein n=1 Tax=Nicotiana tomentosiformis TaxID=4098 RepID=UPI00388C44CA